MAHLFQQILFVVVVIVARVPRESHEWHEYWRVQWQHRGASPLFNFGADVDRRSAITGAAVPLRRIKVILIIMCIIAGRRHRRRRRMRRRRSVDGTYRTRFGEQLTHGAVRHALGSHLVVQTLGAHRTRRPLEQRLHALQPNVCNTNISECVLKTYCVDSCP